MSYQIANSSTAFPLIFLMVDSADHITGKTGLTPTVTISKNGASFASPAGSVSEIGNGLYKVAGNATDSNTNGPLYLHAESAGADPTDVMYFVVAYNPADSVRLGLTGIPDAAAGALGGLPLSADTSGRVDVLKINGTSQTARDIGASVLLSSGTGTGQISLTSGAVTASVASGGITSGSFAANSITASALATDAATEITTAVWANATRSLTTLAGLTLPAITTNWLTADGLASDAIAEIQSGLATSSALATAQADLDIITGTAGALIDSGTGAGQINLSSGSVVNVTNVTNLTNAPTSGDLTATMKTSVGTAALAAIVTYDPPTYAELEGRTLPSASYFDPSIDVVAHVTLVDTATELTNLPAISSNWITAAGLADDAVTEIQSGLATSAALATAQTDLNTITGAAGVLIDVGTGAGQLNLSSGAVVSVVTTTNLTNAPTAGDLTATMKTSVETAAAAALTTYDPPTNAELQARTLEASAYFDPATDTVATITNLTNLPAAPANWLTSSAIHSNALSVIANAMIAAGDIDGYTLEQILKLISASVAGKTEDTETGTLVFRAVDDSKARITAVTDSNNNRTTITYDAAG